LIAQYLSFSNEVFIPSLVPEMVITNNSILKENERESILSGEQMRSMKSD